MCGSICPHVCLLASGSERAWLSGLTETVSAYETAWLCTSVCAGVFCYWTRTGVAWMSVWLQLVLRCIHTYPLQFSSYCEQPDFSRKIAAVLKLLLLENLQGKMVCNSHPALPLCCPCCWRCFHTALVWLHKEKRQEGISSRNNIGHFSPPPLWRFKKVCWQWKEGFASYSFSLPLCFLYSHHVSHLFFPFPLPPSTLVFSPSNGSLMQYAVFPHLSVNEAYEYSWRGGWHRCMATMQRMFACTDTVVDTFLRDLLCSG